MRIESAQIQLSSSHYASERHVRRETLSAGISAPGDVWEPGRLKDSKELEQDGSTGENQSLLDRFLDGRSLEDLGSDTQTGSFDLAVTAGGTLETLRQAVLSPIGFGEIIPSQAIGDPEALEPGPEDEAKVKMIIAMIERLTGKKVAILSPTEYLEAREAAAEAPSTAEAPSEGSGEAAAGPRFGLRYESYELHEEQEATRFQAQGVVRTADGKEIAIDIEMGMSRSFRQEISQVVEIGAAVTDPLVINFNGPAADLTERTFRFDLDRDGSDDNIHFVGAGSGFLTIDRNADGTVNDGGELFGPASGDGFAELAAYDDDGNGFIDEGDAIYDGLRIWTKDGAGNDQLFALGEKGVGAIYLGKAETPFDLKGAENDLQGQVRSTGFYLSENGGAGTVQQIDLVI
jgi:hypothetical protein